MLRPDLVARPLKRGDDAGSIYLTLATGLDGTPHSGPGAGYPRLPDIPARFSTSGAAFTREAIIGAGRIHRLRNSINTVDRIQAGPVFPPQLGWSHYLVLQRVEDGHARSFYEIEAAHEAWSVRELERQVASLLFERLAKSRNEKRVLALSRDGHEVSTPADVIKDPFVLEFAGLSERHAWIEHDLERAIIDRLEDFLLELGKGFCFVARQKRLTLEADHFYVDLVFYNRLLRCFVLIDLKLGKLTHEDLGQMMMYVNWFDRFQRAAHEAPTVGIVLCSEKNDAVVRITLPDENCGLPASVERIASTSLRRTRVMVDLLANVRLKRRLARAPIQSPVDRRAPAEYGRVARIVTRQHVFRRQAPPQSRRTARRRRPSPSRGPAENDEFRSSSRPDGAGLRTGTAARRMIGVRRSYGQGPPAVSVQMPSQSWP